MTDSIDHDRYALTLRSKRHIVLTGTETEQEAHDAEKAPIVIPKPPVFQDVHSQRVHVKQKLAAGFRLLAKFGWDEGVAGHMTVRDPEYPELFWVNRFGQHFSDIKASDLVLVDHEGQIVRGDSMVNKAAFVIHAAIHAARADVNCAVHTHSMYGRTFSALGRCLLPITQDACAFFECHNIYDDFGGVVFDHAEGQRLVGALGNRKALILQNHGLLTTGKTVDEAIWWFISMERCCQTQLLAEAAVQGVQNLKVIRDDVARATYANIGTSTSGWFQFQPMYQMIIQEQPECLE
ncbi:class II aldolase/adducin N-terminal [Radiomyces spectabilis]|uniref:class II aldolase/adducin N-terminal n=1 Tax=Radiomyces spectabilis TaxID=64574 RepID=UPI0022201C9B|nr:class II aldolase/adducin N-terminal [Radiomyces spectabilis]KAI8379440.1 class II aldolase/adducin N-terminal [Radiomyces spectabilis]